ncbi:hypothetical protein BT96DRAFT_928119 [Gymnopus androsaceus JB14]|uniref:Uncharacterized protein n=1 Tax=Gymnopus androsaceus JB14 TaxID=1447944 RepID=A0A6A4GLC5_9AGAR|nr:hypothetical protein BT96DRAFT_928119 [Gymnopus androsaceus JB14]
MQLVNILSLFVVTSVAIAASLDVKDRSSFFEIDPGLDDELYDCNARGTRCNRNRDCCSYFCRKDHYSDTWWCL